MDTDIVDWTLGEMCKRGWNQSDLARNAGKDKGVISRFFNRQRPPSPDLLTSIARAFKYPPEFVFRMAGLLPKDKDYDPTNDELNYLYEQLPADDREDIIELMRIKIEKRGRHDRQGGTG